MIYFHYCQTFLQNANDNTQRIVRKKISEFINRDSLRGIGSVASYTNKIYVLNISSPHIKIIIEEQRLNIEDSNVIVYFIRDVSSNSNWLQNYVQIRDGKWIEYNPLPDEELTSFLSSIHQSDAQDKKMKELPPDILTSWHKEYKLKVDYDIYESEEWVKFAINNSYTDGMKDDEAKLYQLALEQLSNAKFNPNATYKSINKSEIHETKEIELNGISIFYREVIFPFEENPIFLLINGANKKTQEDHYKRIMFNLSNEDIKIYSLETVQRMALRAYPKWALSNPDLWKAIQKNSETGNLSLLPEQTIFLKEFTFPKYINGQAGSGKSTMLYYLFANTYFFKCFGEIPGDIIFLTENENLLKHTKKSIIELLQCNPEFELSLEDVSNVDKHFVSFKEFLLKFIPEEVKDFRKDMYLDFSKFKIEYEKSAIQKYVKNKYSAELAWFAISTYIFGYNLDFQITSTNYELEMPSEGKKLLSLEDITNIERDIIPFYRRLIDDYGYWDKIKIIRYIKQSSTNNHYYDVIFCDEAQDFSRVELRFILSLSTYLKYDLSRTSQVPIVFAGDALQTVNPTGFRTAEVKDMLYEELKQIAGFNLDTNKIEYAPEFNYRSSQPIVNVANAIQYWRKKHFDAIIKKPQIAKRPEFETDSHLNIFIDFENVLEDKNGLIGKLKYKIFIIPVNFDEKEEFISSNSILQLFPEANIKTAVEAKGIDYEQVVIFGFGDYSRNIESLEEYEKRFFYNKLYVAVTRAQLELIILDSKDSEINFWKKLIDFYADSNWSEASEVDKENICETIVYGGNQIPQIIQSTPEMALLNASKDQQQGIFTKNPFLLRIAANQFLKLGNKKEHFKCLAIMHKLKSEWSEAAKFFLKIEVGNEGIDEAAKVYWEGKLLREFINFQLKEDTEQNLVKSILAKLLLENSLEYRDYRILHEKRNKLRIVLFETPWNDDILEALLEIFTETSDRDNIKILIDIFEEICTQENRKVWKVVGDKNLLIKRFEYAIEAYERCSYEGINYIVAKIEIAKERDENLEEIFWLGAILVNNDSDNKFDKEQIRSKILQLYQKNKKELFSRSEQIPQVLLIIYGIFLHYGKEIIEVLTLCIHTETHYLAKGNRPYELIDFYWEILINTKNNSIIYQFLLNRWVRVLFLTNNDIGEINDKYRELCIHNKIKYHSFNESEIKSIPEKPSNILNEPPKHLKNVIISNFRQFNEVNIENLGLLNLVVGDNNVGKTTFLESLLFTTDKDELIRRWGVSFIERKNLYPLMSLNSDAAKYYYLLDNDFLEDFLNNKKKNEPIKYTINNKRSEWQYSIYVNSTDQPPHSISSIVLNHREDDSPIELNAYETVKTPFIPYGKGFGTDLAKVLFDEILSNKNEEKRFISSMKIFIPTIESVIADTANGAINIYDSNFPYSSIPLHQYGEGANKMFRILLFLVIHRGQRVLIDEIDSGIHFTRFRQFWHVVLSVAIKNNTQLVMTTHNEECIRYYSEALQDMDFEAQRKSRVVQLKKVNDELKVRSYEFQHFHQAIESNLELRGGKL